MLDVYEDRTGCARMLSCGKGMVEGVGESFLCLLADNVFIQWEKAIVPAEA